MFACRICLLLCALVGALAQPYIGFDTAKASSIYSAGNLAGSPDFAAGRALDSGSGYWCSAGGHAPDQVVSWTGTLDARRKAIGLKINWAYGPGEVKILTSPDGANFEEARCWQSSPRDTVSYEESVMFDSVRNIKAVTVAMRGPKEWQYFGINEIALIAGEPEPFMLISGITSETGEQCLSAGKTSLSLQPCLQAIAAGEGYEIFQFTTDGQMKQAVGGQCVVVAGGVTSGGGSVGLADCGEALRAGDGRSLWEVAPNGQLKMSTAGNYCLTMSGTGEGLLEIAPGRADASSSQAGHEASSAVDGDAATYWASAFDASPVILSVDLGGSKEVTRVEIDWEYPAKAFQVELATAGGWSKFAKTSGNALTKTVALGSGVGSSLRIRMDEANSAFATSGKLAYGIREVRVYGSGLKLVVQDCGEASGSADARDKWFLSAVTDFNPEAKSALGGYALLKAAADSLGSITAQLQAGGACAKSFLKVKFSTFLAHVAALGGALSSSSPEDDALAMIPAAAHTDMGSLQNLVEEARQAISSARASV